MIRKGIIIDTLRCKIDRTCEYDDKIIEGMFVKVDGDLLPAAYVYPIEHTEQINILMRELTTAKMEFDAIQSRIFYKELPKYRK